MGLHRKTRTKKRDPLKREPLSQAGDSASDKQLDLVVEPFVWLAAFVVCGSSAWTQWSAWRTGKLVPPHALTAITIVVAIIAIVRIRKTLRKADSFRLGVRGERLVGQLLEELRPKGYRIFHDIQGKGFNVDHVIIGPGGVFVIETKTVSKPAQGISKIIYDGDHVSINGFTPDRDPVVQAKACRDHVRDILTRASTINPKMRAAVLYPGWWVETCRRDVEVWVLNETAFVKYLDYEERVLSDDQIAILSEALATHVRAAA